MKSLDVMLLVAFLMSSVFAFAQPGDDLPINREPGKCYAKCLIPDEFKTVTEQVLVKAATTRVETIPAKYETVTEQVMTKEASSRIKRKPAEYETVTREYVMGCPDGYQEDAKVSGGSGEGDCIKMVPKPAKYETVTEQVMVKEASSRMEIVPAVYENAPEEVQVKPVAFRTETIPAEYETVTEKVMAKEASSRIVRVPAEYRTETERIETKPAATKWVKKKADGNCLAADPEDCLVWCLVEVPAEYQTVTKRIRVGCADGYTDSGDDCIRTEVIPAEFSTRTWRRLKTPATTRPVEVPAEYKTINRRVVKTPATTRTIEIPAEYTTRTYRKLVAAASTEVVRKPKVTRSYTEKVRKPCPAGWTIDNSGGANNNGDCIQVVEIPAEFGTRSIRKVVSPATTKTIEIPAEYTTVTKRSLVKKGGFTEWTEILCAEDVTSYTIRQIQKVLKTRGYDPGPIDNILGSLTKAALIKFQKDNSLPVGQLDKKTLKHLGVRY